jgi:hypothetical protein
MSYVFWRVSSSIRLQPEKITTGKKGRVRNRYFDPKKKNSSHLSGGCAIVITTEKKKF